MSTLLLFFMVISIFCTDIFLLAMDSSVASEQCEGLPKRVVVVKSVVDAKGKAPAIASEPCRSPWKEVIGIESIMALNASGEMVKRVRPIIINPEKASKIKKYKCFSSLCNFSSFLQDTVRDHERREHKQSAEHGYGHKAAIENAGMTSCDVASKAPGVSCAKVSWENTAYAVLGILEKLLARVTDEDIESARCIACIGCGFSFGDKRRLIGEAYRLLATKESRAAYNKTIGYA